MVLGAFGSLQSERGLTYVELPITGVSGLLDVNEDDYVITCRHPSS